MPPGNFLRGPAGHDGASAVPALGSHVDDVIGSLDDVEVVLDHDGGIAALDKFAQDTGQLGDVVKMEAGGGLVQDVDGPAGALAGVASLMRWASPPESSVEGWPSLT